MTTGRDRGLTGACPAWCRQGDADAAVGRVGEALGVAACGGAQNPQDVVDLPGAQAAGHHARRGAARPAGHR